jgi:cytochrome c553
MSLFLILLLAAPATAAGPDAFSTYVRPVLTQNCGGCHNPDNPKNRIDFLKAATAADIERSRGLWRNVATQLRNRTMPPAASKLSEDDRLKVSQWISDRLRQTACSTGEYAGSVPTHRLNRREYRNTIRDLFGIDYPVHDVFPADGSGGEGFDTNGETLYIPPVLMERYLEAAQQILDRAIVTPPLNKVTPSASLAPPATVGRNGRRAVQPNEHLSTSFSIYMEGEYELRVWLERPRVQPFRVKLILDGNEAGVIAYPKDSAGGPTARGLTVRLARGPHSVTIVPLDLPIDLYSVNVEQRAQEPSAEKKAVHYRLLGTEPGEMPSQPRIAARRMLANFLRKAFRRPVDAAEIDKFLQLYDRAAERNDPYEERIKLMLKAVLVSPHFLFKIEQRHGDEVIRPLRQHELATRLSFFLWSTMPDDELTRIADEGKLQDPTVLAGQVDRMLDDPRSRAFANSFIGQWLGTQDVGGRVAPTVSEVQHFYTPDVAADLREEPVLLFHDLLAENRSLLDLIDGNYSFLNERLVRFYELTSQLPHVQGNSFQRVEWPDRRRGGVLGLGAVLAVTSHFKQTSPVLRGAWILETLLGTPVPSPPPDVPPLETAAAKTRKLTMRQQLMEHRANPACSACHNLMDPIGFGLENFDWLGRWRDAEDGGQPLDTAGTMPSGERFNGPTELRQVLLNRKEEFLRHLTGKVLGYALGRSLHDADQCTIQRIADKLEKEGYRARTLVREVVLSAQFRSSQGKVAPIELTTVGPRRRPRLEK